MHDSLLASLRRDLDDEEVGRLSPHACLSRDAIRRHPDPDADEGHRQHFALDADRVLHSRAYTRYIDKTQVFSLLNNDQITHRVLHVQLVSKIGRTVGRLLGLNQDLIEAIALAHDIGHPPFGHDGETFLSALCREHGLGPFMHNIQSVHFLERVEKRGQGLNLSLQVLDGVLCHDGEVDTPGLEPQTGKNFAILDEEMAAKVANPKQQLIPMTLEGCVVRICDTVAYIGRDLEDAITVGLLNREDLPEEISQVLGKSNGTIVYRLVSDLVANSQGRRRLAFSPSIAQALAALKRFNLERIYTHPAIKSEHHKIKEGFARLFNHYIQKLNHRQSNSRVFTDFLDHMEPAYALKWPPAVVVRDFLASMTDEYFMSRLGELIWPRRLPPRLDQS